MSFHCSYQDPEGAGDIDLSELRVEILKQMLDDGRRYIQRSEPIFHKLCLALGGPSSKFATQGPSRSLYVAYGRRDGCSNNENTVQPIVSDSQSLLPGRAEPVTVPEQQGDHTTSCVSVPVSDEALAGPEHEVKLP